MLLKLLDHLRWADAEAASTIATLPDASAERAEAVRLYAHIAAATHVWLTRLEGRPPEYPIWPELSLAAAGILSAKTLSALQAFAGRDADGLAVEVAYRNSAGEAYRNTIAEVLTHVALHGSYHRGQIALLARQGGGRPAATDYIVFLRRVPAAVQFPASPRETGT